MIQECEAFLINNIRLTGVLLFPHTELGAIPILSNI